MAPVHNLSCVLLISLVFPWAVGSRKSPDNSFLPKNIQCPPGRFINNTNVPYPTFTVEISKSNETWPQLLREADERHFSPLTGVMVWLGVKIFPETDQMRVCLKERDPITGHGSLDPPITGYISTDVPCQATITIPKRLIYHGVPNQLIPPTTTPDYILDLELIREAINSFRQA